MSLWVAALMGLIQGLTEFLPVSSSGHLELAKALLGDEALTEAGLHFTIVLHAATALATIMVFRKDIAAILIGLVQGDSDSLKFALAIILSMVPAV
ncbi:undecaprenyl-diphosphate phosphatase, partial [Schleiferiaceae bacterium]|nr:undecaprenyl-diphosphate phosphatase [Schleiferiaceae bacterium]